MANMGAPSEDSVAWARRVNRRWIVHHGLKEDAEAYLNHLEASEGERLRVSCERARRMVRECGTAEDPKPWFYAGLFSRATAGEVARFFQGHWFTVACVARAPVGARVDPSGAEVSPATQEKLDRIRAALSGLDSPDGSDAPPLERGAQGHRGACGAGNFQG